MIWMLLACQSDGPAKDDTATADAPATVDELGAPGPYAVGYRQEEVAYTDPAGEPRTLRLALWWPTDAASGAEAAYWNGAVPAGPGVYADAAVATGPFPLAVFSHGHQGYAENSSFLMEHLASHGWIVAAPDHTGNTTLDGDARTTAIYYQRPADLSAVLDHLDGAADPVGAAIDRDGGLRAVAIGHSFGGYTLFGLAGGTWDEAALACPDPSIDFCSTMTPATADLFRAGFRDERVIAALPMAPGDYGLYGAGLANVTVPTMLMGGGLDPGGDGQPFWDVLSADDRHRYVRIDDAGHQSFTDFSGLLEDFPGLVMPEEGFRIVDVYALAWARAALGDTAVSGILSGEVEVAGSAHLAPAAP